MARTETTDASVAIVLVNWKGWRDSIACIESCLALAHPSFRVILCDNDSGDRSVEQIAAWARGETPVARDPASPVTIAAPRLPRGVAVLDRAACEAGDDGGGAELLVVQTGGNLGFAGGNNVGLRWALARGCRYAWLLNNDTVVPSDALTHLVAACEADPAVGMCGSTMVEYYRPDRLQGYAAAMDRRTFRGRHLGAGRPLAALAAAEADDPPRGRELMYPIGASILVTRAFLETVGLMEESYFLYYEEPDWVLRGEGRFRTVIARDSLVFHKVGASAGSTADQDLPRATAFLYRSRLRIARLRAPSALPAVVVGMLREVAYGLVHRRTGRAIAASRALTGRVKIPTLPPPPAAGTR